MLIAPFVLAAAWPSAFGTGFGDGLALATVGAAFVMAWATVVVLSSTARFEIAAAMAMTAALVAISVTVAAAGGLGSPVLLCIAALAFEPWWIARSRKSLVVGAAAAAIALLAQPVLAAPLQSGEFLAWHWLLPAAYAALALPRLAATLSVRTIAAAPDSSGAIEDVIDAVVVRLAADGEVTSASRQSELLLGVAPSLLLGEGLFERIHIGDRIAYLSALADMREGKAGTVAIELRLRSADQGGASRYLPFAAELNSGNPATLLLRRNEEIESLRRQLADAREQADRIEVAKSRFLAAVSHELRTPLNAIIGFSDMLAHEIAGPFTDPRQRDYSGLIRDAGGHLLEVVNSILDVSKIESGAYPIRPEPFRFEEVAGNCHAMLALMAARKNLHFLNEVTQSGVELNGDRRAVQQILINLLSNAVKFTPEGGTVRLAARRVGRQLAIEVSDTGIGISESDLERLGRPFEQVDNDYTRQFDGAGLGLSIANGLVALHGGSLSIASAPGEGTSVTVTLPVDGPARKAQSKFPETEERSDVAFRKSA